MFIVARPSILEDIYRMAPRLRKEDIDELEAMGADSIEDALMNGFLSPDGCFTAVSEDGEPVFMFGTAPHPLDEMVGCIWMLGTPDIEKCRIQFLRSCKQYIEDFHNKYPVLMNYTDARNDVHHRWLKWCGFTFINKVPTPGGFPFYEFVRVRN